MPLSRTVPSARRGQAFLEMAISLPIILLLMFGIAFFGTVWARKIKVTTAARYAAWGLVRIPEQTTDAESLKKRFGLDNVTYGGTTSSDEGGEAEQSEQTDQISAAGAGGGSEMDGMLDTVLSFVTGSQKATVSSTHQGHLLAMIGREWTLTVSSSHVVSGTPLTRKQTGGIFNNRCYARASRA